MLFELNTRNLGGNLFMNNSKKISRRQLLMFNVRDENKREKSFDLNQFGFTLIELLAVIVILALIALIATPMILGVIDSAKKGAAESSTYGYISALEHSGLANIIDQEDKTLIKDGIYDLSAFQNISFKGANPKEACVTMKNGMVEGGSFQFANYIVDYIDGKAKINDKKTVISCEEANAEQLFNEQKGVNIPQLSEGMTPVKWDSNNNEIETTVDDPEWYDYAQNKWANVKTKDNSYFVWIPRYAYKIVSGYHETIKGSIDIKFLKGTTNKTTDETKIETDGYEAGIKDTSMHYFTHPSFNENSQLGFWVAKYEASVADPTNSCNTTPNVSNCNKDNLIAQFVPNVSSWRYIMIGNAYNVSLNMKDMDVYGWNSAEVNTHMIKNTEWGAIAYLTYSKYGRSDEIWVNASMDVITGCGGQSASGATFSGCPYPYDSVNGKQASSTGNLYGIYDLSGGAWEFTSAYINNGNNSLMSFGSSIINATSENKDIYKMGNLDEQTLNYEINKNYYGDAIYETSSSVDAPNTNSWNNDYSHMPNTSGPWFVRGGINTNRGFAGLFYFYGGTTGGPTSNGSFRPVVNVVRNKK